MAGPECRWVGAKNGGFPHCGLGPVLPADAYPARALSCLHAVKPLGLLLRSICWVLHPHDRCPNPAWQLQGIAPCTPSSRLFPHEPSTFLSTPLLPSLQAVQQEEALVERFKEGLLFNLGLVRLGAWVACLRVAVGTVVC